MKGPMFRIHPWQNSFDLSITGHFLEVHVSEDDETCLYCRCDVTRGQGVKAFLSSTKVVTLPFEVQIVPGFNLVSSIRCG